MFVNLRKKLNSVIQEGISFSEISTSYIKQASSTATLPVSPGRGFDLPVSNAVSLQTCFGYNGGLVNFHAGAELLADFEKQWVEVHSANEENASLAVQIDADITEIRSQTQRRLVDISDMNVTLSSLPTIISALNMCMEVIDDLSEKCGTFERKMIELEDMLEVLELQERQLDHRFEMAMYKEKKLNSLERVREQLAKKHAANVLEYEKKLRQVQQERQLVFQDAFQDDLKVFKATGSIPKVEAKSTGHTAVCLEEIDLGDAQDGNNLDEFLDN